MAGLLIFRTIPLTTLLLSGCLTVGPDYKAPTINLPENFVESRAISSGDTTAQSWWLGLNDPILNDLVARGQVSNLDIQTAILRIADMKEQSLTMGMPALFAGNLTVDHQVAGGDLTATSTTNTQTLALGLDFDLFGGNRRSREQALANLDSSRFDLGTTRQIFMNNLVTHYLRARYYQEAMAITHSIISNYRQTLVLVEQQVQSGTSSKIDEARIRARLQTVQTNLPSLETGFNNAVFSIATLLAEPVGSIMATMSRGARQPLPLRMPDATGVPADLLRNRPDVRAAERRYAASLAEIGIAEAAIYPSLRLSGTIISSAARTWSYGPSLLIPILNQPILRHNVKRAVIRAEQSELAWQSAVYSAVEEVQSAQAALNRSYQEARTVEALVRTNREVVDLTRQSHNAGAMTILELLDAQREYQNARLSLAAVYRDIAQNFSNLQISAGYGWIQDSD